MNESVSKKQYIADNAQLMVEWDVEKNNAFGLDPNKLSLGSDKRAAWICKTCGHKWETQILKRTIRGQGCPVCAKEKSRKKQEEYNALKIKDRGSLADKHPYLVTEWDYNKNAKTPYDYLESSNQSVFWKCSKCGHEWKAQIIKRTIRNQGCPICAKEKLLQKQNELYSKKLMEKGSFADKHPDLLKEWDFDKNDKSPKDYLETSNQSVFWKCSKCGHQWKATIANRSQGSGCKKCAALVGKKTLLENLISKNGSLMDNNPLLAKEWHPTKNGELTPHQVMVNTNKSVWWKCGICDYEWKTAISNRNLGSGCPKCAAKNQKYAKSLPIQGINDLASQCPDLAKEWHPTKNGLLKPSDVARSANKKVWWLGKCGHEWQAVVGSRYLGRGCPICRKEFKVSYPEKAIFYYLKKYLQPLSVLENYKAEWLKGKELDIFIPALNFAIEYDGENWHTDTAADTEKDILCAENDVKLLRIREGELPKINSSIVFNIKNPNDNDEELINAINYVFEFISVNYNKNISYSINLETDRIEIYELIDFSRKSKSLQSLFPDISKEWHPSKNGKITPEYVNAHSHKKFWWLCPQNHEYDMTVKDRVEKCLKCPICSGHRVLKGYNDLETKRPDIAREWHPTHNAQLKASDVMEFSNRKVWWLCPNGHSYQYSIAHRTKDGRTCPICSGRQLRVGVNDLVTINKDIASEWNYDLNGDLRPEHFTPNSHKRVWWRCNECGHEWNIMINNRYIHGSGCPKCAGKKRWEVRKSKLS